MKTAKQNQTDNHQKEGNKREDKKKTNIKFNSVIFFQIGLVIALVASAWVMNLKVGERSFVPDNTKGISIEEPPFIVPVLEEPKIVTPKTIAKLAPQVKKRVVTSIFKPVDNDTPIIETKVADPITAPVVPDIPIKKSPVTTPPKKNTGPENINSVEFVPIYPGCEFAGDNKARIACMNEKISRFVSKKFDTTLADDDTQGNQRITVQFKIDKNGNVLNIKAHAKDKNLQKEAQRVISRLPEFTPGKMGETAVDVMYMLPITFQIN